MSKVNIKELRDLAETETNPHVLARALGRALDAYQYANENLIETARQLDAWADESKSGGWSTHQVDPMRKKADDLRRAAAG